MSLSIKMQEVGDVVVVALNGRLVFGQECASLRDQIKQLLATDKRRIVLNMEAVSYSDSAGLGYMTSAFTSTRNQGGALKFAALSPKVQEVLSLTRLDSVFEVYPSEAEALASFE